jgi:hypothetical protein
MTSLLMLFDSYPLFALAASVHGRRADASLCSYGLLYEQLKQTV